MEATATPAAIPPMLVQLTVEELAGLIDTSVRKAVDEALTPLLPQQYASSLKEFAEISGKSETTLWRMKKQGELDGALHQHGHSIIVDIRKGMECINNARIKRLKK